MTAKNARLPGMEDAPIKDLEELAVEHSDALSEIREKRDDLKAIKTKLVAAMKKLKLEKYVRAGIKLNLKKGHDDVSVQVKRHDREDGEK